VANGIREVPKMDGQLTTRVCDRFPVGWTVVTSEGLSVVAKEIGTPDK
jgi:hypothetical protein